MRAMTSADTLIEPEKLAIRVRPRRLTRLQRRLIVRGVLVGVILLCVLAAPFLTPFDPRQQNILFRLKPAGTHVQNGRIALLGTDQLGRDIFSRILYGGRISFLISISAVVFALIVGVALGLIAGYRGGAFDVVIMRLVDIQLGFPGLLLAITLAAALGPGITNVVIALGISHWTTYTRVVRSSVLTIKQDEFVQAARVVGCPNSRILVRHILPNTLSSIIVIAALHFGQMILAESSLSFLGLGIQPPTPSWGAMINEGRQYITSAWWLTAFPGLAITLTVLAIGRLGDALRDLADPHLRTRGV